MDDASPKGVVFHGMCGDSAPSGYIPSKTHPAGSPGGCQAARPGWSRMKRRRKLRVGAFLFDEGLDPFGQEDHVKRLLEGFAEAVLNEGLGSGFIFLQLIMIGLLNLGVIN